MFTNKEEYINSLKQLSDELGGIYDRASIMKVSIKDLLSGHKIYKVDDRFFNTNFGGEIVNDTKVAISLRQAMAGNLGNMGKTYGELYELEQQTETRKAAIELTTSTGVTIGLIIFKGDEFELDFDDDKLLKVYGIIIDMKKNPQFVDKGGFYGRTLNLYADVPTFVLGPKQGVIHGIANYSKPLDVANDEEKEEKKNAGNEDDEQVVEHDEVFVVFDHENPDRHIVRQEGNIIDFEYYYGISEYGRDYEKVVIEDIRKSNVVFKGKDYLTEIRDIYKQPLVNYKYQNREKCALTIFYAEHMNVEVLRLDITGIRSTEAFNNIHGFTSSSEYGTVERVFTVIPDKMFSYDIEISASDFMAGLGFSQSKRFVFIQAWDYEELEKRAKFMKASYQVNQLEDDLYEYIDTDNQWGFRAFLCGPDFKFVDKVAKL